MSAWTCAQGQARLMCNCSKVRGDYTELKIRADFGNRPNFPVAGEIFPKRPGRVMRQQGGTRELVQMTWGFPPPPTSKAPVTNVRNLASPFWRSALANPERRCLAPVSEFAEPDQVNKTGWHWFGLASGEPFWFAGVWRPTDSGDHYVFLTTEANELVGRFHRKVMPVILTLDRYKTWLSGDYSAACGLAPPCDVGTMRTWQ